MATIAIHDLITLQQGGYRDANLTHLKLASPLTSFPEEILSLGLSLTTLDLSGTGLSSLPSNLGAALPNLKTILLDNCSFAIFPSEAVSSCPNLTIVSLANNQISSIPEDIPLPSALETLIVTNNRLTSLPKVPFVPCKNLSILRLSHNSLTSLPRWLFTSLPSLSQLSFAANPCCTACQVPNGVHRGCCALADIPFKELEQQSEEPVPSLGFTTATVCKGQWKQSEEYAEEVAVLTFWGKKGEQEMDVWIEAGAHESLLSVWGRVTGHPGEDTDEEEGFKGAIVAQLVPEGYYPLAKPPSALDLGISSTTEEDSQPLELSHSSALAMLASIAGALSHLHEQGIAHGNLHPSNILASTELEHALLVGFGEATIYRHGNLSERSGVEKIEVLAFAKVLEHVLGLVKPGSEGDEERERLVRRGLEELRARCSAPGVEERPAFEEIREALEEMVGWRRMMRIPG